MTRYAYDGDTFRLRRMRSREYTKTGDTYSETGVVHQDNGYAYDLDGNILGILDKSSLGTELANTDVNTELDGYGDYGIPASGTFLKRFAYDSLNRLLSADGAQEAVRWSPAGGIDLTKPWSPWTTEPDTPEEYTETYGWDLNGNLTSLSHTNASTSFTRNFAMVAGTNRLDEVSYNSGTTISGYAHDAAGNVVQENSSRHFVWDHANRLREFRSQATPTSSATIYSQYLYDASGQRVTQVVTKGSTSTITTYIDGIFDHVQQWSGTTPGDDYAELHVMDGDERVGRYLSGTPFDPSSEPGEEAWFLTDHLGSASFTLEANGSMFRREEYSPFGETQYGSYERKRYRFGGKEKDDGLGLNYHSARYYAPWTGRWMSCDPAGMVDGPNLYAYVRGNPMRGRDPFGHQSYSVEADAQGRAMVEAQDVSGTAKVVAGATNAGRKAALYGEEAALGVAKTAESMPVQNEDDQIVREPDTITPRHPLHSSHWEDLEKSREALQAKPHRNEVAKAIFRRESLKNRDLAEIEKWYETMVPPFRRGHEHTRPPTTVEMRRAGNLVNNSLELAINNWALKATPEQLAAAAKAREFDGRLDVYETAFKKMQGLRQHELVIDVPSAVASEHYLTPVGLLQNFGSDKFGDAGESLIKWGAPVGIQFYYTFWPGRVTTKPKSPSWEWTKAWAMYGNHGPR